MANVAVQKKATSRRPEQAVMKISQIMKTDVETCGLDDNLAAAASRMWDGDIGCLPVLDAAGQLAGIVTEVTATLAAICAPRQAETETVTV